MDTHELAKILIEGPKREITVSIDVSSDVSSDDSNAHQRCFSDLMHNVQWESNGTVTFLCDGGYDNGDA